MLPLLSFYIWATILVMVRIYTYIWNFQMMIDAAPVVLYISASTLKFAIGIGLVWVNVELSLSIYYSMQVMR